MSLLYVGWGKFHVSHQLSDAIYNFSLVDPQLHKIVAQVKMKAIAHCHKLNANHFVEGIPSALASIRVQCQKITMLFSNVHKTSVQRDGWQNKSIDIHPSLGK